MPRGDGSRDGHRWANQIPSPKFIQNVNLSENIWKPIPVRIFYTFVIYQGYDMDILSGKSYGVIYHGYDMDIPNANNLELHILVIICLTFGQIF